MATMAVIIGVLLAQADLPSDVGSLQGWLQIAASTGFAGLAWYLIVIRIPKDRERADIQMAATQERFDVHMVEMRKAFEDQLERQRLSHAAVITDILNRHEKQLDRIMGKHHQ